MLSDAECRTTKVVIQIKKTFESLKAGESLKKEKKSEGLAPLGIYH